MSDEIILGANFNDILKQQDKVIDGFGRIQDSVIKMIKATEAEGVTVGASLKVMNKEGAEALLTFKAMKGILTLVTTEVTKTADAIKNLNTGKKTVSPSNIPFTPVASTPFASDSKLAIARNKQLLDKLISESDISLDLVNKMWGDLATGNIDKYDGKALKVITLMEKIESASKKITAREESKTAVPNTSELRRSLSFLNGSSLKIPELGQNVTSDKLLPYQKMKEQLIDFVKVNNISRRDLVKVWTDVESNMIQTYSTSNLNKVRDYFTSIQAEQRKLRAVDTASPGNPASNAIKNATKNLIPESATNEQKQQFAKMAEELKRFALLNEVKAKQIRQVHKDLANGIVKDYGGPLNGVRDRFIKMESASIRAMTRISASTKDASKIIQKFNKDLEYTRNVWKTLVRLQISNAVSRSIGVIRNELNQSVRDALELSRAIGQISTVDVSNSPFSQIRSDLVALSKSSGLDVLDVAKAQYQALSNQVASAANSFEFMDQANKLAVSALSTSTEAVDLMSSAINAFGLTTADSEIIASSFFKTLELGRLVVSDLANAGKTFVLANQLGSSLFETQATLALFTRQGIKAAEAATLLRAVYNKLLKPTQDMKQFLSEIGFESGEAAVKTLGFAGVMQKIEQRAFESGAALGEIGELFKDIRAVTGAAIFSDAGMTEFNRDLKTISESTGTVEEAFQKIQNTSGQVVAKGLNEVRVALIEGLGNDIIETVANIDKATGAFGKFAGLIQFTGENIELVATAGTLFAGVYGFQVVNAMRAASAATLADNGVLIAHAALSAADTAESRLAAAANFKEALSIHEKSAARLKDAAILSNLPKLAKAGLIGAAAIATAYGLYKAYSSFVNEEMNKMEAAGKEMSESFAESQKIAFDKLAKNISEANRMTDALVQSTINKTAQKLSSQLAEASAGYDVLFDKVNLLNKAQTYFEQQAGNFLEESISESKKGLSDLENQLEKLGDSAKSQQDVIRDLQLEAKLEAANTTGGQRKILDTEIQAIQGPSDDEEGRLRRLIELLQKRKELANTTKERNTFNEQIIAANIALKATLEAKKLETDSAIKKKKADLENIESQKEALELNAKKIETTIAEIAKLKEGGKENEAAILANTKLNDLLKKRQEFIKGISEDLTKSGLDSEEIKKLEQFKISEGSLSTAIVSTSNAMLASAEELNKAAAALERQQKLAEAQNSLKEARNEVNKLNQAKTDINKQIDVAFGVQGETAKNLSRGLTPQQLKELADIRNAIVDISDAGLGETISSTIRETEFASENQAKINSALLIVEELRAAIQSGNIQKLVSVLETNKGQASTLAEFLTNQATVSKGKLSTEDVSEIQALATTLDNLPDIIDKNISLIKATQERAVLEEKLKIVNEAAGVKIANSVEALSTSMNGFTVAADRFADAAGKSFDITNYLNITIENLPKDVDANKVALEVLARLPRFIRQGLIKTEGK